MGNAVLKGRAVSAIFKKAFKIIDLIALLTESYSSLAFDKLAGSINQLLGKIGQFSREEIPLDKKNYSFLMHDHFIGFINELPEEFNNSREKLAINLNNLGAHYQKKELKFVYMIFMSLRQLNCSEAMKKTIIDNSIILSKNYKHTDETESDESNGFGCFSYIGFVVLIIIIARACGSGAFNSSTSYNNDYFQSQKYKDLQKIIEKNTSIFSLRIEHTKFINQIKKYYNRKDSLISDSINAPKVPEKPYYTYYMPFGERLEEGDSVLVENSSKYDVVVFGLAKSGKYSIGVPAGTKTKIQLHDKDLINLYIGRNWDKSYQITANKRAPEMLHGFFNGAFRDKAKFTIQQLNTFHEYRNPDKKAAELKSSTVEQTDEALMLEEVEIYSDPENENLDSKNEDKLLNQTREEKKSPVILIESGEFASFEIVLFSKEFTRK